MTINGHFFVYDLCIFVWLQLFRYPSLNHSISKNCTVMSPVINQRLCIWVVGSVGLCMQISSASLCSSLLKAAMGHIAFHCDVSTYMHTCLCHVRNHSLTNV